MGQTSENTPLGNRYILTPESVALREKIKDLWQIEGWSAGMIGRKLGVTRNVVIGHVQRMKLPSRGNTGRRLPPAGCIHAKTIPKPPPMPVLVEAPLEPLHVGMDDLGRHTCRWPYGNAYPFTFCGHPTHKGGKYCAGHHAIAFVKSHGPKAGMQGQSRQKQQFGLRP